MDATSFEDFLEQMKMRGYEIKQGKHISFRAKGQERFTRGKTLGMFYDEEHIRSRIDNRIEWRKSQEEYERHKAVKAQNNPFITDDYIGKAIDINNEKFSEKGGLRNWAILQNMQNTSKLLNQLTERNIGSPEELDRRITALYDTQLDIGEKIKGIEKELAQTASAIRYVTAYIDYKNLYKQYKSSKNPDAFYRKHEQELREHELAKKAVKGLFNENGRLPNPIDLKKKQNALERQKAELMSQYQSAKSETISLNKLRKSVFEFLHSDKNKQMQHNL